MGFYSKDYYPLRGTKGTYREPPQTLYLSVVSSPGNNGIDRFIYAVLADDDFRITEFNNPSDLIHDLTLQKNKTWVITYELDYIGALFENLVTGFDSVSGYGEQTSVLTLKRGDYEIYLIDGFSFFLDSLSMVLNKIGLKGREVVKPKPRSPKQKYIDYCKVKVIGLAYVWQEFRGALRDLFGVHPSKTPGATALKSWKTTLKDTIKVRGKPYRKFGQSACMGGALYWKQGFYSKVWHYDINAAYPHVQRVLGYPVNLIGFVDEPPPLPRFIATVKVNYTCNRKFSPLTVRLDDGSIVHPTEAQGVRVTLTYIDVQTLKLCGELEITEWIEGVSWGPDDERFLFREWAEKLETRFLENPEVKPLLKVSSRALHSKFSQRPGLPIVEIRKITPEELEKFRDGQLVDLYPLPSGELAGKILHKKKPGFQPYLRPEFEALTLSMARYMIHSAIDENTIYVDTDSIISTVEREDLQIGLYFGQWKLEASGPGWIAGPRMYVIGKAAKASGIRTIDKEALQLALVSATRGFQTVLTAIERGSLLNPTRGTIEREHTIQTIKYPHVTAKGGFAWVTRSPTVKRTIKNVRRIIS